MSLRLKKSALYLLSAVFLFCLSSAGEAQEGAVAFGEDHWRFVDAQEVDHAGRQCLVGTALVKDVELHNGVIEVDLFVTGRRSYPGIFFHIIDDKNAERFYIRPHRAGLYPDALQYMPIFNGSEGWQLYHGEGCTGAAVFPENEWFTLKLEIAGTQARVYLGGAEKPALVITDLKHGDCAGRFGLVGPKDGSAFFSNFRYRVDESLAFEAPAAVETPEGTITDWEVSRSVKAKQVNQEDYPSFFFLFLAQWQKVETEPTGLLDIARYVGRSDPEPDVVLVRTRFQSEKKQRIKLSFGYSDEVSVFFNRSKLFYGNSAYQKRDKSFVGIVGLNDTLYLNADKGLNEILMMVTEKFGGWGLMCRADVALESPKRDHSRVEKLWETPAEFDIPESVMYDPAKSVLYVSNYNRVGNTPPGQGYISKLSLQGEILEHKWVPDLDGPCGMALRGERLYVVECYKGLVEIDTATGAVLNRYPVAGFRFLNDLAMDDEGAIYISNTTSPTDPATIGIYRFKDGKVETWKTGYEVYGANGLFVHEDKLIIGNTGDGYLKAADLRDPRVIENVISLAPGVIDGIRVDRHGNLIVSQWEGQVFRITPAGDLVEILDMMPDGLNTADLELVPEQDLLVIPTFLGKKVVAYKLLD